MNIERLKESPEDIKIIIDCLHDITMPWTRKQINGYLYELTTEELFLLYKRADNKRFFSELYTALGEPAILKKIRVKKASNLLTANERTFLEMKKQNVLFPELLELPKPDNFDFDPWKEWQLLKR